MLDAKLEGGPLDGAGERIDAPAPPEAACFQCHLCDSVHIFPWPVSKLLKVKPHRYRYDRTESSGAIVYVYAEMTPVEQHDEEEDLIYA